MIFFLFHAVFSTAFAFVAASLAGHLNPLIAALALIAACGPANWGNRHVVNAFPNLKWRRFSPAPSGRFEVFLFTLILLLATRQFAFLLTPSPTGLNTLNQNNLGDLPCHINYIRAMAAGTRFPILNPEFAAEPLRYPFGTDLYNALWECLGIPLHSHLFLTGTSLCAATLVVLRWFGGWWTISAFFFSGGCMALAAHGDSLSVSSAIDWKNLFLSVFVTQRGFLVALPLGCLVLHAWRCHVSNPSQLSPSVQCVLGLIFGLLPLFHAHTFVAVSLFILTASLIEAGLGGLKTLVVSRFLACAVVPATYFVLRSTDGMQKARVIEPGAFLQQNAEFSSLWHQLWCNFGLWLLVPGLIVFLIFRSAGVVEKRKAIWRLFSILSVFCLFLSVKFAPWSWDNIKLLIWPYLLLAQLAYEVLYPVPTLHQLALCGALSLPGLASLVDSLRPPRQLALEVYQRTFLNDAEGALQNLPADSVFIAAPDFNHPLTYFGRFRVLGYEGHLFSHAVSYVPTAQKQRAILTGDPHWRTLTRELQATHIYWGPHERRLYGDTTHEWMSVLTNVSKVKGVEIYPLHDSPTSAKEVIPRAP